MTASPEIKPLGVPTLGDSGGIDRRSSKVQESQAGEVGQGHALVQVVKTVHGDAVDDGEERGHAQCGVHVEACSTIRRLTELGTEGEYCGCKSKSRGLTL